MVAAKRRQFGRLPLHVKPLLGGIGRLVRRRLRKLRGEFREELIGELFGGAVDEAKRAHDVSWEAIEQATPPPFQPVAAIRAGGP